MEPGSARAVGTRGLLWAEQGLQPAWARSLGLALPGCSAQPGHALALPFVSEMISRRGFHRHLGYQLRGIQNTYTFESASFNTLPHLSPPVQRRVLEG